jgi:hypothetical protein
MKYKKNNTLPEQFQLKNGKNRGKIDIHNTRNNSYKNIISRHQENVILTV